MFRHWTILSVVLCACGGEPAVPEATSHAAPEPAVAQEPTSQPVLAAAAPVTGAAGAVGAGGLRWTAPEAFVARSVKSPMRAAEYSVAGEAGAGELAVFYFGAGQGGGVEENMARWIGQFTQPDGSESRAAAKIDKRTVGALPVTRLDLTGTFSGGMPPMVQQAALTPQANYRVLGAIAEGPQGPVFFKLIGPAATLEASQAAFDELLASLSPAG